MSAEPRAPVTSLSVLLAGQASAVAALVVAGERAPVAGVPWARGFPRWFAGAPPVDALVVVGQRVGLLVATWLLLGTVLHLVAALVRSPALLRATAWATVPAVRRAVASVVVTAGVLAPSTAGAATNGVAGDSAGPVRDGRAAPVATVVASSPVAPPASAPPPALGPGPASVVVQPGDSLWSIATAEVASATARPLDAVTADAVTPVWARIVEANAARLQSGDVSLIYPGEEVVVPEP
ncbi:MAG: LysM peptidoglycan-binding domain-containing protein [Acidimicrobiia bacterium]